MPSVQLVVDESTLNCIMAKILLVLWYGAYDWGDSFFQFLFFLPDWRIQWASCSWRWFRVLMLRWWFCHFFIFCRVVKVFHCYFQADNSRSSCSWLMNLRRFTWTVIFWDWCVLNKIRGTILHELLSIIYNIGVNSSDRQLIYYCNYND